MKLTKIKEVGNELPEIQDGFTVETMMKGDPLDLLEMALLVPDRVNEEALKDIIRKYADKEEAEDFEVEDYVGMNDDGKRIIHMYNSPDDSVINPDNTLISKDYLLTGVQVERLPDIPELLRVIRGISGDNPIVLEGVNSILEILGEEIQKKSA